MRAIFLTAEFAAAVHVFDMRQHFEDGEAVMEGGQGTGPQIRYKCVGGFRAFAECGADLGATGIVVLFRFADVALEIGEDLPMAGQDATGFVGADPAE